MLLSRRTSPLPTGSETILVAEDDANIRAMFKVCLDYIALEMAYGGAMFLQLRLHLAGGDLLLFDGVVRDDNLRARGEVGFRVSELALLRARDERQVGGERDLRFGEVLHLRLQRQVAGHRYRGDTTELVRHRDGALVVDRYLWHSEAQPEDRVLLSPVLVAAAGVEQAEGAQLLRFPTHKDETDLELAFQYARQHSCQEVLLIAALGERWDMSLANIFLTAHPAYQGMHVRLVDNHQELMLLHSGESLSLAGQLGDTVSLIPLSTRAQGITTQGLEYALANEDLVFGSPRGVSNVFTAESAIISLREGLLICVVIHNGGIT